MLVRIASLSILSILLACDGNADSNAVQQSEEGSAAPAMQVDNTAGRPEMDDRYVMERVDKEIEDEYAPLGYWDRELIYPQVTKGGTEAGRSRANAAIEEYVHGFICEQPGELTFNSKVRYIDQSVLSFTYSAMWLCSGMPHPDSVSGTFNVHLETGKRIELAEQLSGTTAVNELAGKVRSGLNRAIMQNDTQLECGSAENWQQFYLTDRAFVFTYHSPVHGRTPCEAEFRVPRTEMRAYLSDESLLVD